MLFEIAHVHHAVMANFMAKVALRVRREHMTQRAEHAVQRLGYSMLGQAYSLWVFLNM